MKSDINVAIIEDDNYSLNWMSLLLVRDWRTRVISEISSQNQFFSFLKRAEIHFDIILLDVDTFNNNFNISQTCSVLNNLEANFKVVCIGCQPDERVFDYLSCEKFAGYIMKSEIGYSLSWAISFVADGQFIFTKSTQDLAFQKAFPIPSNKIVISGRSKFDGITDHESEVARLAIIFSLGRRDLADELKISDQWSYGLVSELYEKLGLTDMLSGNIDIQEYIGENFIIKNHINRIMSELGSSKKAKDMETLAFHLLTMPIIEE